MKLSTLPRIVKRSKKRVGRGHGSGKVKTAGRGTKGQGARETVRIGFEGGQLPIIKRLPLLRGKDRNKGLRSKAYPLPVEKLNALPKGTTVSLEILKKHDMIRAGVSRVKILGKGTVTQALAVALPCSKSAKAAIEKAGGTVTQSRVTS